MAARNRALNIAFRTLVGALALLSLTVIVIQRVPALRAHPQLAGWFPPAADKDIQADAESAASDPFSGSVSGGEEPKAALTPTPIAGLDTIDMPTQPVAEDVPDAAPAVPASEPAPSSDRYELRLAELERRYSQLEQRQAEAASQDWDRVTKMLDQLESHSLDVKNTLARMEETERQMQELREEQLLAKAERQSEKPTEDAVAAEPERIVLRTVEVDGRPKLAVEARDASLAELLARLGEAAGLNLVVSPSVTGTVSLHLNLANAREALQSVCKIHRCRTEQEGSLLVISRDATAQPATPTGPPPETITKLYRLKHLTGSEIRPYVASILTPGVGTVSFASVRERVTRTGYREPPRAILVKDTAEKLVEVERLIEELDRQTATPPTAKRTSATTMVPASPVAVPSTLPAPPALLPPPSESAPILPAPPCQDCEVFEPPIELPALNTPR